jgi:hypothetical protein
MTTKVHWLAWGLGLVVAVLASGCPEQVTPPADLSAPCKEVGQRCEFSPGKLGSCVLNDNCRGPSCFICQSQH